MKGQEYAIMVIVPHARDNLEKFPQKSSGNWAYFQVFGIFHLSLP